MAYQDAENAADHSNNNNNSAAMNTDDDGANKQVVVSADDMVRSIRRRFQERMSQLAADATKSKNLQEQVYTKAMLQLPKSVRQMSVDEFNTLYGCDLIEQIKSIRDQHGIGSSAGAAAGASYGDNNGGVLETPAPARRAAQQQPYYGETPLRTVRRGAALRYVRD